jgi:type IV pilus assembly protein PilA
MKSCQRRTRQRGFSLIELLVVIAIILIIMAIAVPQYNKARMISQETAAIEEMRTIINTEVQYNSQFNSYGTLAQLGPAAQGGQEGPNSAGLIPAGLATGASGGYNFTVTVTQGGAGYTISAVPKAFGSTGRRTFYTDQTNVIHQNWGQEPATASSPEIH